MKHSSYQCNECKKTYVKWTGYCNACGLFDSIKEFTYEEKSLKNTYDKGLISKKLHDIEKESLIRYSTGFSEINRVLGGGLVQGSVLIITGDPGIGKSTLLLQCASGLEENNNSVLYISSEESIEQVAERARRININSNFTIAQGSCINSIIQTVDFHKPKIFILDSIQNCFSEELDVALGGVAQIKYMTHLLVNYAKKNNVTIIMTAHITKEGTLAGPKTLEHLVDVVVYVYGEEDSSLRTIKSSKNRFGSTEEIGFLKMTSDGFSEKESILDYFVEHKESVVGSSLTFYKEGSRTFLVEIQALVIPSRYGMPQRVVTGIDHKQFVLLISIIERYVKIPLHTYDIFCKVAGGLKIKGNSIDLAISAAIISSFLEKKIHQNTIFIGEIGVTGSIFLKSITSLLQVISGYSEGYSFVIPQTNFKDSLKNTYNIIENLRQITSYMI